MMLTVRSWLVCGVNHDVNGKELVGCGVYRDVNGKKLVGCGVNRDVTGRVYIGADRHCGETPILNCLRLQSNPKSIHELPN